MCISQSSLADPHGDTIGYPPAKKFFTGRPLMIYLSLSLAHADDYSQLVNMFPNKVVTCSRTITRLEANMAWHPTNRKLINPYLEGLSC